MTYNLNRLPGIGDTLDDRFADFLASDDAGQIINRFVQLAREQANRGRKVSAKAIAERMRWDDEHLSINNSLVSRLARYVMAGYPDLAGYFDVRELRAA